MCNFLRTSEITFLYLKLASCENKLLILTSVNSKYSELKRKIKVAGQTWGRKILQLYTLNTEFPSAHFFQLLRCDNPFYFSLGNLIFNIVLPAIFITQLAHSCFPFSFVVEELSAKVMYRTGQSAARPTATGTPHGGRRPGPRTAAGGRSATAADPARAQPAGGRS